MNTVTHMLVGAAVLTRRGQPARNRAALAGALLPDAYIFAVWGWSKLAGISEADLWRKVYWSEPVQLMSGAFNSVPIYAALLLAGAILGPTWLWVLAAGALIHLSLDFPVHTSDAHRHFWPFSDWRFESPISYWEGAHHAAWVGSIELLLVAASAWILWVRFPVRRVRAAVALIAVAWLTPMIYFGLTL